MTQSVVNKQRLLQFSLNFSLISSLLLVTACQGSQLGNTLGESLEPDPQLLEGAAAETESDTPEATPNRPSASDDSGDRTNKPKPAEPPEDSKDTEAPQKEDKPPAIIAGDYTDIDEAPEEIQPYLVDLIDLELLEIRAPKSAPAATSTAPAPEATEDGSTEDSAEESSPPPAAQPTAVEFDPSKFRPNQAMTRREYARWLLAVNNRFYASERTRKIRPGVDSSQPVFQDVPVTDEDFAAIQGLAEAGIIPSPLTGSSTTLTFRPDAPLTRKDLLLWKVPLDTRQALPEASVSAVQQAWGFQDAGKIDPRTQQAVLADYQNGDFANIRRAFNYTTLFQPDKAATRAEGTAVLWRFGNPTEGITAAEVRNEPDSTDG
ncbi:MAG: S-layer protein [Cyanobacteria bacterium J06581_3]